ncbi:MAG: peptide MFS transporter [Saprospiraceae bacterium]|jgi:POT family proton-dependent oligopeptide transporter|nr:peptide MFS transporter [Saprospiraceae bacterium]
MAANTTSGDFFKTKVLGHPAGLFTLFFTEMWERFSFYGMRALLVLFLTSSLLDNGWGWPRVNALALYGTYTSMVYLTPIIGGILADKFLGHRNAIIIGASLMTLGHASMAMESQLFLYLGLTLLIFGNGFFKPNMTSMVAKLYKDYPEKKDGAYTIFYMGVNSGAFLGIMLCGYIGEKVGFSWGFGLAGIFMFFGMLQFYLSRSIFGNVGLPPDRNVKAAIAGSAEDMSTEENGGKLNPFSTTDLILVSITAVGALVWVVNDPMSKVYNYNVFGNSGNAGYVILGCLCLFLYILFSRILRYSRITRDRMLAVFIIAVFYMFFWASFEQAGGSMTIFAKDYMDRTLVGNSAILFKVFNSFLTIVPLGIITFVLWKLFKQTFEKFALANIFLGTSFIIIWAIVIWMLSNEFSQTNTEIAATWFGILNSFFIIALGPVFSKIWESKYNPSASVKYSIGLVFLSIGFLSLAYGAYGIPFGAKTAAVSILWLVVAYLFHTLGELCISPVGLSYVSKLVPGRMIAVTYGIWYLSIAVGNKVAGTMGGMIDSISAQYGLSNFFLIFTIIPVIAAVVILSLGPLLRKLMHGVR